MICEVEGRSPSDDDLADYAALLSRLVAGGAGLDEVGAPSHDRDVGTLPAGQAQEMAIPVT